MKIPYTQITKEKTQFHNLSACEWKAYLYLTSCQQEETGRVEGLHYKDVMNETDMCKQSFYNALEGLEEKGIICAEKNSPVDYDVVIHGNAMPWKGSAERTYREGYISLSRNLFVSKDFKELKPHAVYLALYFMKCTHCANEHSFHEKKENFLAEWSKLFDVTERVIKSYLHSLKKFFSIGVKDNQYYVTCRKWILETKAAHEKEHRSELSHLFDQLTRKDLNRNHISYTKEALFDTSDLIKQYREQFGGLETVCRALSSCIEKSVEGLKRKERTLNSKYIHKLLKACRDRLWKEEAGSKPPDGELPDAKQERNAWQEAQEELDSLFPDRIPPDAGFAL